MRAEPLNVKKWRLTMSTIKSVPRVIVTGNKNGHDTIIQDDLAQKILTHDAGFTISDIWATSEIPVKKFDSAEIFDNLFPQLHKGGTLFRYVSIPPDSETKKFFPDLPGQPHPLMHKTQTLDYIIILSGQLYLIMEDTETELNPGDIVIQCATNHAWSNRTEQPCIQLAIILDAQQEN